MSAAATETFDTAAFTALQAQLVPNWPNMTMRRREGERTLVVVTSISFDLPPQYAPLLPAYEERYLSYVLSLAEAPRTRVIYVTSQPVLPRMLDYYLGLIPTIDRDELKRRLFPVSVGDWSTKPLTAKILERPRLLARIRSLIPDPQRAILFPFATTALEARLSVELGIPIYGPDPRLAHFGTKTGGREIFRAAGAPHPRGAENVRTVADIVDVLDELRRDNPPVAAVVKLDDAVSGLGNAIVDLRGADHRHDLAHRVRTLVPEDGGLDPAAYLELLERAGGIVEERIVGSDFRSPSVQLRASPEGTVEVLSTHDQILGGPSGQTYFGCRFPADGQYGSAIAEYGLAIGEELARRGVIGRFAVDFVATRRDDTWAAYAIEINLRSGGTTHPYLALLALTEGEYDTARSRFTVDGVPKYYVATDHLETPNLRSLTPDDVLDVVDEHGLGWDHAARSGLVFHMLSGVGVAGRLGVTAIANSPEGATALYDKVEGALSIAAGSS